MTNNAKVLFFEDDTRPAPIGSGVYLKGLIAHDLRKIGVEAKVHWFPDIQDAIDEIQTEEDWKIVVTDAIAPYEETQSVRELLRFALLKKIPSIVVSETTEVELVSDFYYFYKIARFFAKNPLRRIEFQETIQAIYLKKYGNEKMGLAENHHLSMKIMGKSQDIPIPPPTPQPTLHVEINRTFHIKGSTNQFNMGIGTAEALKTFEELKTLVSTLEINDQIKKKVENHLQEANLTIEAAETGTEPKSDVVNNSLENAIKLLKSAGTSFDSMKNFIEKAEKLGPYLEKAAGWLAGF